MRNVHEVRNQLVKLLHAPEQPTKSERQFVYGMSAALIWVLNINPKQLHSCLKETVNEQGQGQS